MSGTTQYDAQTTAELEAVVKKMSIFARTSLMNVFRGNDNLEYAYWGVQRERTYVFAPWNGNERQYCSWQGTNADDGDNNPFTGTVVGAPCTAGYSGCTTAGQTTGGGGYDPTYRPWYYNARIATDHTVPTYNPVDVDAATNNAYIAISKAIYTGAGASLVAGNCPTCLLHSVVAVDVAMTPLKALLDSVQRRSDGSSWSGYGYLVGSNGGVALHKECQSSNDPNLHCAVKFVEDAEFGTASSAEKTTFINTIKPLLIDQTVAANYTGFRTYTKRGAQWVMAFAPARPSPYMVVVTVMVSDLQQPAQTLEDDVAAYVTLSVVFASIFGVILVIFSVWLSLLITRLLAMPIAEQAQNIMSATDSEYTRDIVEYYGDSCPEQMYQWPSMDWTDAGFRKYEPHCVEMLNITNNLEEMQVAMRFSNYKYLTAAPGNPKKVYRQAMEVVNKYDNKRGIGVCWSSIGNTMGDDELYQPPFRDAGSASAAAIPAEVGTEACLINAIRNAEELLQETMREEQNKGGGTFAQNQRIPGVFNSALGGDQVDKLEHRTDGGESGVELGVLESKKRLEEQRSEVDAVYKSLATRELSLGMYYSRDHRFQQAFNMLWSSEKRLTELMFGDRTVPDMQNDIGCQPGHRIGAPALLDNLFLSGRPLNAHSPSGIVAAYGKVMWFQMKNAITQYEAEATIKDVKDMSFQEKEVHFNTLREQALPIARQLQRTMQVHLEPRRVVDGDLSYCWAAIATTFIESDPRYALGALQDVSFIEKTTLRILIDSAIWFATYPNPTLKQQNEQHPMFTAGVIAEAVQTTLQADDLRASVREEVGPAERWKFPLVPPPPGVAAKALDHSKLNPPWAGGGKAAGPTIKAVSFVLDVSGSMAGGRMARTKANLLMVFDKYINAADDVCYIEFNTRVTTRVPLSQKSPEHRRAMEQASAGGGTNFYDAMMESIQQLGRSKGNRKKYIIALTDGANGRSQASVHDVCSMLKKHEEITPFIIGAGGDIPYNDVSIMQQMVGENPPEPTIGGKYVKAERTEDLEAAFEAVAQAMNDCEMETL